MLLPQAQYRLQYDQQVTTHAGLRPGVPKRNPDDAHQWHRALSHGIEMPLHHVLAKVAVRPGALRLL